MPKQSFEMILNHWITTVREEIGRRRCPVIKRLKDSLVKLSYRFTWFTLTSLAEPQLQY